LLLLLGLGGLAWYKAMQGREMARAACLAACRRYGVQLLDDTVVLERLWPEQDRRGRWRISRSYGFEFSSDGGLSRQEGRVVMVGTQVEHLYLAPGEVFIP
ncbi:MAG: DUF3301 domain-containing protein, partial [Candidatus Competibacteraceae bacterium]|nr:DUF3301 domain-containing protein [Candidatus Competibacteraceae bacterium]